MSPRTNSCFLKGQQIGKHAVMHRHYAFAPTSPTFLLFPISLLYSQHQPLPAMSSPASPRGGEVGEVARQSRRGCPHSRKAAFLQVWQSGNVDSYRTPPPTALHLSALRAAEEDIATYPPSTAHNHIFASITDLKAPALPFVCTATQGKTTSAVIPKRSFISPMPETIHSVHAFRLPKDLQAAVSPIGCLPARWTIHSQLAT